MNTTAPLGPIFVAMALALAGCFTPTLLPLDHTLVLGPDQGILVVELQSNEKVPRLAIKRTTGLATSVTLKDLASGRRAQLLVLPAGSYRWSEIDMEGWTIYGRRSPVTWTLDGSQKHFHFIVRPGVVNYPGVLVLHRTQRDLMRIYTLNRSAELVQSIREKGGRLVEDHRIVYSGRGRDDFLEFYTTKLAGERGEDGSPDASPATSN